MALRDILKNIPLFKNLSVEDLDLVASRLRKESHPKGIILFQEGDPGDTMLVVESGQLLVLGEDNEALASIGPGNFVGDISVLLGEPRSASVQVNIDAQLWALHKEDFDELVDARPSIALEIMRELSRRLVTTTRRREQTLRRRITALLGSHKGFQLSLAIHEHLNSPVAVLALPEAILPEEQYLQDGVLILDNTDLTEAALAENLSYQVEVYQHIVLLLPENPTPLARKAIDLSDTVVSIGPPPSWLKETAVETEVWKSGSTPTELSRTARRLINRTVGLALSSGGSRGLAHIGVMKVLLAENIPVDLMAGTSAGALFGAFMALGKPPSEMDKFAADLQGYNVPANWDINIPPRTGLIKGRKARDRVIAHVLNNAHFKDTQIPFYIVAGDILTGEEVVFDSGPLADAIRASLSVPVLADPWHYQDRYFVDGGAVNPLPASVLRERGADIVIASNVVQPLSEANSQANNQDPDQTPSIFQSVFNIFSAMEAEMIKKQLPLIDVLIHHNVSTNYTLDFENAEKMVDLGAETARQMLPTIREALIGPPHS